MSFEQSFKEIFESDGSGDRACFCTGPKPGEEKCPCSKKLLDQQKLQDYTGSKLAIQVHPSI